MLISAVPLALGVLPGDRDKRQVALSSFIGEVLKDLEVSLLERLLQEKHAAREQVLLAARQSQKTASTVSHRLKEVERAEEQLAMCLSAEEAARIESDAMQKSAAEAEAARSTAEAQLLVGHMELDLCRSATTILLAEVKEELQMQPEQIARVQKICDNLGLEDSLRCTLPLVLQKRAETRSFLEKAAAQLITKALQAHMEKLSKDLTSEEAQINTEAATARAQAAEAESKAAVASWAKSKENVKAAKAAAEASRCRLDQARAEETRTLVEYQDASSAGAETMELLRQLRKGALLAYQSLEGPVVPVKAENLERKIADFEESCRIEVREVRRATEAEAEFGAEMQAEGAEGGFAEAAVESVCDAVMTGDEETALGDTQADELADAEQRIPEAQESGQVEARSTSTASADAAVDESACAAQADDEEGAGSDTLAAEGDAEAASAQEGATAAHESVCDAVMSGDEETALGDTQADETADAKQRIPEAQESGQVEARSTSTASADAAVDESACTWQADDADRDDPLMADAEETGRARSVFSFGLATMLLTLSGCSEAPEAEAERH